MNKAFTLLLLLTLTLLAMHWFEPVIIGILILISYIVYLFHKKNNDYQIFLTALGISIIWYIIAKEVYNYNQNVMYKLIGIQFFPIMYWTIGLTAFYYFSKGVMELLKIKKNWLIILLKMILSTLLTIIVETIGYNLLGIRLVSNYEGLPFCNCMHAPHWMIIMYFLNGYIFIIITEIIDKTNRKTKNDNKTLKK